MTSDVALLLCEVTVLTSEPVVAVEESAIVAVALMSTRGKELSGRTRKAAAIARSSASE